jgi:D-alanyl-lipoteichoic acid acyltransferase DltB (MBOAT superfamily)
VLFNSFEFFFLFLPVVLLVYFLLEHRRQNIFLVIASCIFYASWDWRFLLPLLFTTSLDFWIAKRLEILPREAATAAQRRRLLALSVASNLSLLGFFKYFNFFLHSLQALLVTFGLDVQIRTLEIVLPIAISFYTFQALSYTIDVYRGEFHATKSFWDFFLAVLYFPHLVAGPIQRAASLIPQMVHPRAFDRCRAVEGIHLIAWGYFKKIVIADNLAPIVDSVFGSMAGSPPGGMVSVGVVAFAFQIYCDFSGYTDIARGIAKLMGIEFVLNFNLPYFATSPSDFWKRWHISLSSWLRDYLYRSLGGNRSGTLRTYRNLIVTMLLGGLWHGAAWNFVLWGFYHGLLLVCQRLLTPVGSRLWPAVDSGRPVLSGMKISMMFLFTCYGWLLFRAHSFEQIVAMSTALSSPFSGADSALVARVAALIVPIVCVQLVQASRGDLYFLNPRTTPGWVRVAAYTVMIYFIAFRGGQPQAFVYFQF